MERGAPGAGKIAPASVRSFLSPNLKAGWGSRPSKGRVKCLPEIPGKGAGPAGR